MDRIRFAITFAVLCFAATMMAILAVFIATEPSHAQEASNAPMCMAWPDMKAILNGAGETATVGAGRNLKGGTVVIFSSPEGKQWTMALVGKNGTACVIMIGSGWTQPGYGA